MSELHVKIDNQELWIAPGAYVSMEGDVEAHVEWKDIEDESKPMGVLEQLKTLSESFVREFSKTTTT